MGLLQFSNFCCGKDNASKTSFKIAISPLWSGNGHLDQFLIEVGHLKLSPNEKKALEKKLSETFCKRMMVTETSDNHGIWNNAHLIVVIQNLFSEILFQNIHELMVCMDNNIENSKINILASFSENINIAEKSNSFKNVELKSATYEKAVAFLDTLVSNFDQFNLPQSASKVIP